jgi:hypothetical protein
MATATPTAALAASKTITDPKDAKAPVDIRSMSASSGKRLAFRFHVRDLRSSGVFIAHWHGLETVGNPDSESEQMVVVDHRNGKTRLTFWSAIEIWDRTTCKGMRSAWRPDQDIVRVSVPTSCVYYEKQKLRVDGHSAYRFRYHKEHFTDNFPANKPDKTAHFRLAVS